MSKAIKGIKIKTRDIATAGIFLAFILIFVLVPIPGIGGVDMAFISLIAVILAATVKGLGMGLFAGTAFGIASLIKSFIRPDWTSPMFHNPAVSILPRVIIPITVYFSFKLIKRLFRNKREDMGTGVASTVATVVGVCTNTLLVLGMWAAFYFGREFVYEGAAHTINGALFAAVLSSNFVTELIICTVLCPILCTSVRIALGLDKRGPHKEESEEAKALGAEGQASADDATIAERLSTEQGEQVPETAEKDEKKESE